MQPKTVLVLFATSLVFLVACDGADSSYSGSPSPSPQHATVTIDTADEVVLVEVQVADSPEERATGLMDRKTLGADEGMLFVFFEPTTATFWMKDTLIPLSIAFFDRDGKIISIQDMEPCKQERCRRYGPDQAYWGALEVNQGAFDEWGVEVGDTIRVNQ